MCLACGCFAPLLVFSLCNSAPLLACFSFISPISNAGLFHPLEVSPPPSRLSHICAAWLPRACACMWSDAGGSNNASCSCPVVPSLRHQVQAAGVHVWAAAGVRERIGCNLYFS